MVGRLGLAALLALGLALVVPSSASAFIYWAANDGGSIGRANNDGSMVQDSIVGALSATGVAVNSSHQYWIYARYG